MAWNGVPRIPLGAAGGYDGGRWQAASVSKSVLAEPPAIVVITVVGPAAPVRWASSVWTPPGVSYMTHVSRVETGFLYFIEE